MATSWSGKVSKSELIWALNIDFNFTVNFEMMEEHTHFKQEQVIIYQSQLVKNITNIAHTQQQSTQRKRRLLLTKAFVHQ